MKWVVLAALFVAGAAFVAWQIGRNVAFDAAQEGWIASEVDGMDLELRLLLEGA